MTPIASYRANFRKGAIRSREHQRPVADDIITMPVFTTSSGAYYDVAETVAAKRGESLVTDPENEEGPLVYVADPTNVDEDVLLALQERLQRRGPDEGAYSIITGRTPAEALALHERTSDDQGDHCVLLRRMPDDVPKLEDGFIGLTNNMSANRLRQLDESGLASLNLRTGGWSIHLRLGDGFICGYPTTDSHKFDGRQPFCVSDGEIDCPLDAELLHADELAPSHVFVASCASIIDNNMSQLPVNVGIGLLSGATSMVGSYYVGASIPQETLLHHSALRAGYSVAERTYFLNWNARINNLKYLPYLPFGRPSATLTTAESPEFEYDYESDDSGASVTLRDVDAYLVDVTLPRDAVPGDGETIYARCNSETQVPLYYLGFDDGDRVRVVLYTGGRLKRDHLDLRVSKSPVDERSRQIIADSVRSGEQYRTLGALHKKADNQVKNLGHKFYRLTDTYLFEKYDAHTHREITAELDDLQAEINRIRDEIYDRLGERRFYFRRYSDRVYDQDVAVEERRCPTCGRRTFRKQYMDVTKTIVRSHGVCPRCGHLYDVPTTDGDCAPAYPVIEGDLICITDDVATMTVTFENPKDVPIDAVVRPQLQADHIEGTLFTPARTHLSLDPGERQTTTFEIDAGSIPDNQYYVFAHVIGNLDVYVGVGMMVVGEQTGRKPYN